MISDLFDSDLKRHLLPAGCLVILGAGCFYRNDFIGNLLVFITEIFWIAGTFEGTHADREVVLDRFRRSLGLDAEITVGNQFPESQRGSRVAADRTI